MSQIVIESSEQQFTSVTTMAEVRDKSGRLLGHFVRSQDAAVLAALESEVDDAELQRRFAAGGGRSLQEILKDLGASE